MHSAFGERFEVPAGYLNTASIGVPPVTASGEVAAEVRRWQTGADRASSFDRYVATARESFGRLVGVPTGRVAIGASVSQLAGLVAASVPDGTRVLTVEREFTSVTFPFAAQAHRGVTVTEVPPGALSSTVDGYDLVAVSVVQSADGAIVDLAALREAVTASGIAVLLDATQAVGWLPLRLDWADWVLAASYKWLLSPRGAAWMAVRPDAMERIVPNSANWYAGQDPWTTTYGLPLRLADNARALDLSPVWFAHVGAASAMSWLASLDAGQVREHCVGLADELLAGLGLAPRGSAIVSLDVPGAAERLASAGITASVRAGRPRLAFHLYNTRRDVDLALAALRGKVS